ncbi:hypothetical protein ACVWYH_000904 [Bradyrhizobium sp. GM24.11]
MARSSCPVLVCQVRPCSEGRRGAEEVLELNQGCATFVALARISRRGSGLSQFSLPGHHATLWRGRASWTSKCRVALAAMKSCAGLAGPRHRCRGALGERVSDVGGRIPRQAFARIEANDAERLGVLAERVPCSTVSRSVSGLRPSRARRNRRGRRSPQGPDRSRDRDDRPTRSRARNALRILRYYRGEETAPAQGAFEG